MSSESELIEESKTALNKAFNEGFDSTWNNSMQWETLDSGVRYEYDSGMVRDTQEGKPRFDLLIPHDLPFDQQLLTRWASLMARGASKYGDRNWEKGNGEEELERAKASAFRHFLQWFCGETDEDHAAAVCFNVQAAIYFEHRLNNDD